MKSFKEYIFPVLMVVLSLAVPDIKAQNSAVITGKVTSKADKMPLVGATVVEVDKNNRYLNAIITNAKGEFAIKISNTENKIVVSFIGYTSQEFPGNTTSLNAALEEEEFSIEEVRVVGSSMSRVISNGFLTVEDRDNVASVKKVDPKVLSDLPSVSIDDAIQGRIAGIDVLSNSGDPGAGSTIKIRNASSLSGNTDPLIVIDGIPNQTRVENSFSLGSATSENFAQLLNISPTDISEISVLTDAASTAVYGSEGSNGVILITTKRGTKGKVQVQYTYRGTINQQPDAIPMLNGDEYATLIPEGYMNYEDRPLNINIQPEFKNDPTDPLYYNYNKNTNWIEEITQTGITHDHNLSLSGGGDKAKYRLSLTYFDQEGTTVGTSLERFTTSLNVDYDVSDKLLFQADFRYSHIDNDRNFRWDNKNDYNVRNIAYKKMPNMTVYEYIYDQQTPNYFSPLDNVQGDFPGTFNPVAMAKEAKDKLVRDEFMPTFRLNYNILKSLAYSFDVRFTVKNSVTDRFLPQIATGRETYDGYTNNSSYDDYQSYDIYTRNALSFSPSLNDRHKFSSVLAVTTSTGNGYGYYIYGTNAPSSNLEGISNTSTITGINSSKPLYKSYASVVAANYSFLDRYIFSGSLRAEADPKFGENYIFGIFGGLGARWRISNENFMKAVSFINDFTIRANWGVNGNSSIDSKQGKYSKYNAYGYSYIDQRGIYPANLELHNYRWEKKTQPNLGINLQMFDQRFNIDVNFWKDIITDGFRKDMPLPATSGFSRLDLNLTEGHNQGVDIDLLTTIFRKESSSLDFRFNISRSQFIVDNISARYNSTVAWNTPVNGEFLYNPRDHTPLGSIFGLHYLGVYKDEEATIAVDENNNKIYNAKGEPVYVTYDYANVNYQFQPGDAMYEDVNHDGNINYNDVVYLGNCNPTVQGGFGSTFRYRKFYTDLYCVYRYNYLIVNMTKYNTENMSSYDNQSRAVLNRWRNPGDETDIPRAVLGTNYNSIGSDRFTEDGSFLRLKTITVGYDLNASVMNKLGVNYAKIYCTITNLLTFTNYTGQDPEVGIEVENETLVAVDNSRTPRSKDITIGLSIRF